MRIFLILLVFFMCVGGGMAYADCTSPAGAEGKQVYNTTHKTMQFCDGTDWYSMKGGSDGSDSVVWLDGGAGKLYYNGGNVGIGVSDPTHTLDVLGIVRFQADDEHIGITNEANRNEIYFHEGGGADFSIRNMGNVFSILDRPGTGPALFNITQGTGSDGGNIGIGTESPIARLHVTGNDNSWTDGIMLEQTGTGGKRYSISSRENGEFSISDETASAKRITLSNNGNVGIGTHTPTQKLEIAGSIKGQSHIYLRDNNGADSKTAALLSWDDRLYFRRHTAGTDAYETNVANLDLTNGTLTATAFVGDGSGLTNLPSGADNLGNHTATATLNMGDNNINGFTTLLSRTDGGWNGIYLDGGGSTKSAWIHFGGDASNELRFARGANNNGAWEANVIRFDLDNGDVFFNNNLAFRGSDSWLRLNQNGNFTSGTYTPGLMRADGGFQVDGNPVISNDGRSFHFGNSVQRLYGDHGSAVYVDSNHDTLTQMVFRDKQDVQYGRIYGSNDGEQFGLLDKDGNWSILHDRDSYTQFRINNGVEMQINTSNIDVKNNKVVNVATPTAGTDAANKAYVDSVAGGGGGSLSCTQKECSGGDWMTCSCNSGYTLTGGGCRSNGPPYYFQESRPINATTWSCGGGGSAKIARIICCQ